MDPEPADADVPKGARIAAAALSAIVGMDADEAMVYFDLVAIGDRLLAAGSLQAALRN